jgi:O-antigen/teichoic acid export membrane protein
MKANLIVKNSFILYIKLLFQIFVSLYTTRVILNALGVNDFGIYNLLAAAVAMFGFIRASLASSTIRFLSHSEGENDFDKKVKIFNISFLFHFIFAIFLLLVLESFLYFFFDLIFNIDPERIEIAKIISHFIILISVINILLVPFEGVLNSHENMLYLSVVDMIRSILVLILALAIVNTNIDKLLFYSTGLFVIWVIVFLLYSIFCFSKYSECKINFSKYFDKVIAKSMLQFSSFEFFGYSTGMISLYSTNLFINSFFDTAVNAAQGIANQISLQLTSFSTTMMKAMKPAIVKSEGSKDYIFFEKSTFNGGKYSFLILVFMSTPFLVETNYIFKIWLKNVPEWAIIFFRLQLIKQIIEQFFIPFGTAIGARGNIKKYAIANSIINLSVLPVIYIFFKLGYPPYFMYFVLIFFFAILGFIINLYYIKKLLNFNISFFMKKIVFPNVVGYLLILILCFSIINFLEESLFRFILVSIISSILILSLTFYSFFDYEREYFLQKIKKIKNVI